MMDVLRDHQKSHENMSHDKHDWNANVIASASANTSVDNRLSPEKHCTSISDLQVNEEEEICEESAAVLSVSNQAELEQGINSDGGEDSVVIKVGDSNTTGESQVIWKCRYCPFASNPEPYSKAKYLVKRHERGHFVKGTFSCDICTFSSFQEKYIRKHKLLHEVNYESINQSNSVVASGITSTSSPQKSYRKAMHSPRTYNRVHESTLKSQCSELGLNFDDKPDYPSNISALRVREMEYQRIRRIKRRIQKAKCSPETNNAIVWDTPTSFQKSNDTETASNVDYSENTLEKVEKNGNEGSVDKNGIADNTLDHMDPTKSSSLYEMLSIGKSRLNKGMSSLLVNKNAFNKLSQLYDIQCQYCPFWVSMSRNKAAKHNVELHEKCHFRISKYTCTQCTYRGNKINIDRHAKVHLASYAKAGKRGRKVVTLSDVSFRSITSTEHLDEAEGFFDREFEQESEINTCIDYDMTDLPSVTSASIPDGTLLDSITEIARPKPKRQVAKKSLSSTNSYKYAKNDTSTMKYCLQCPFRTLYNHHLVQHMVGHGSRGKYSCDKCSWSVNGSASIYKHRDLHRDEYNIYHNVSSNNEVGNGIIVNHLHSSIMSPQHEVGITPLMTSSEEYTLVANSQILTGPDGLLHIKAEPLDTGYDETPIDNFDREDFDKCDEEVQNIIDKTSTSNGNGSRLSNAASDITDGQVIKQPIIGIAPLSASPLQGSSSKSLQKPRILGTLIPQSPSQFHLDKLSDKRQIEMCKSPVNIVGLLPDTSAKQLPLVTSDHLTRGVSTSQQPGASVTQTSSQKVTNISSKPSASVNPSKPSGDDIPTFVVSNKNLNSSLALTISSKHQSTSQNIQQKVSLQIANNGSPSNTLMNSGVSILRKDLFSKPQQPISPEKAVTEKQSSGFSFQEQFSTFISGGTSEPKPTPSASTQSQTVPDSHLSTVQESENKSNPANQTETVSGSCREAADAHESSFVPNKAELDSHKNSTDVVDNISALKSHLPDQNELTTHLHPTAEEIDDAISSVLLQKSRVVSPLHNASVIKSLTANVNFSMHNPYAKQKVLDDKQTIEIPASLWKVGSDYTCEWCDFSCTREQVFRTHLFCHGRRKAKHRCSKCGFGTMRPAFFDQHVQHHHSSVVEAPTSQPKDLIQAVIDKLEARGLDEDALMTQDKKRGFTPHSSSLTAAQTKGKGKPRKKSGWATAIPVQCEVVRLPCKLCPFATSSLDDLQKHVSKHNIAKSSKSNSSNLQECVYCTFKTAVLSIMEEHVTLHFTAPLQPVAVSTMLTHFNTDTSLVTDESKSNNGMQNNLMENDSNNGTVDNTQMSISVTFLSKKPSDCKQPIPIPTSHVKNGASTSHQRLSEVSNASCNYCGLEMSLDKLKRHEQRHLIGSQYLIHT